MALTRQSVRTCLLWRSLGEGLASSAMRLQWAAFVSCLEHLTETERRGAGTAAGEGTSQRAVSDVGLDVARQLLSCIEDDLGPARRPRQTLGDLALLDWLETYADDETAAPPKADVESLLVHYTVGQLCFLLGRLRAASGFSQRALQIVPRIAAEGGSGGGELASRVLHFLTVTLALEVNFHTFGYDSVREPATGRLLTRYIYRSLTRESLKHISGFSELAQVEVLRELSAIPRGFKVPVADQTHTGDPLVLNYLRYFWSPVPTSLDLDSGGWLPPDASRDLSGRALPHELARQVRAGLFHFRYRHWRAATETFERVDATVEEIRNTERWHPGCDHLDREANLYGGRLRALACDFPKAHELIAGAADYFLSIGDVFAVNKARKYTAEIYYRQSDWGAAEELFLRVRDESRAHGFGHDLAVAEYYLGQIYSRFGFQRRAAESLAAANVKFREYDSLKETLECLFAESAIEARRSDHRGHVQSSVATAHAAWRLFKRLVEASQQTAREDGWADEVKAFREGALGAYDPDIARAMLELRLGSLPDSQLMAPLVKATDAKAAAGAGSESEQASALQRGLVLRLVHLQQGKARAQPRLEDLSPPFRRYAPRDLLLAGFESVAIDAGDRFQASRLIERALGQAEDLGLRGGLVPFLVDLSQYFVDRDCFIASVLLLLESLDHTIRLCPAGDGDAEERLDVDLLRRAYRSLTKYLVLERNFYAGPPPFGAAPDQKIVSQKLWKQLCRRVTPRKDGPARAEGWALRYSRFIKGGHGLSYPDHCCGLGWVEDLATGSAWLRILWADQAMGRELTEESFERREVPIEVALRGHATVTYWPLVLVGRTGQLDGGAGDWVAHLLPIDLESDEFFSTHEEHPWRRPRLGSWARLLRRFVGAEPVACVPVSVREHEIAEEYNRLWTKWFAGRRQERAFRAVFGEMIPPSVSQVRPETGRPNVAAVGSPGDECLAAPTTSGTGGEAPWYPEEAPSEALRALMAGQFKDELIA